MTDYKYKIRIQQIVDEMGDLKFLTYMNTDFIPSVNDQIAILTENEDGDIQKRLYFRVVNKVFPVLMGDKDNVNLIDTITLQVELLLEEEI